MLKFPNLKHYYQAAHIRNIVEWMTGKLKTKWREIEAHCENIPLNMLPFIEHKKVVGGKEIHNRWVKETIRVWRQICREQKIGKDLIFLRLIESDPDFLPNKIDKIFHKWNQKGLSIFGQLLGDGEIKSFNKIAMQYELASNHIFRYLQISSYISEILQNRKVEDINPLIKYMTRSHDIGVERKFITNIVKFLKKTNLDEIYKVKNKWEKDLKLAISTTQWEQICKNIHRTTHSNYWKEFSWKIVNRYFKTPNMQKKYKDKSECWRECGEQEADQCHVFWSCKIIQEFWQKSIEELTAMFNIEIKNDPLNLLLGNMPENMKENDSHLFLIARITIIKQITNNWLKPCNLIHTKWKDLICKVYEMEKITMRLRNKAEEFESRWETWKQYLVSDMKSNKNDKAQV